MAEEPKPLKSSFIPQGVAQPSCITFTPATGASFSLSPQLINSVPHFYGKPNEDPNNHLREFYDLCKTQFPPGLTAEQLKLILFPFSLKDNAKWWLNSLPSDTIATWDQLSTKFITKFFPAQRMRQLRRDIHTFRQKQGDLFCEAWESFNGLLRKCPHHGYSKDDQAQFFYEGLNDVNNALVDSACGGAFMNKTSDQAFDIFETLSENSQQFSTKGFQETRPKDAYEVKAVGGEADRISAIEKKLDAWMQVMTPPTQGVVSAEVCALCPIRDHLTIDCPFACPSSGSEQISFVDQQRRAGLSNIYSNPALRNHPNFGWSKQQEAPTSYYGPPGFNHGPKPQSSMGKLEEIVLSIANDTKTIRQDNKAFKDQTESTLQHHSKSIANLEVQFGRLCEQLTQREPGKFPSQTEVNPKGTYHEQAKAITLKSGKQLPENPIYSKRQMNTTKEAVEKGEHSGNTSDNGDGLKYTSTGRSYCRPVDEETERGSTGRRIPVDRSTGDETEIPVGNSKLIPMGLGFLSEPSPLPNPHKVSKVVSDIHATPIPFPRRFAKQKKEKSDKDILEILSKVQVNIHFLDTIKQIPRYAKFIKELCTNKRKFDEAETISVSEEVSAVLLRKLPPKLKDPGRFTIPCTIGETRFEHALLDLSALINLMPYSVYESLQLGELKPTGAVIQLVDRSHVYPEGYLEDVLVKVDDLIFPADFLVLEMEHDPMPTSLPLILGRGFMRTARTKIDVYEGTLTMEFEENRISFNIFEAMRYPTDVNSCFSIDILDYLVQDVFEANVGDDVLKTVLESSFQRHDRPVDKDTTTGRRDETTEVIPVSQWVQNECDLQEILVTLDSRPAPPGKSSNFMSLPISDQALVPSVIQAPTLELKPLPEHLKYAYLGEEETFPVIIASNLSMQEEEKLLRVLHEHKAAIAWGIADIKGISPTTCMHRILLEEGAKPTREAQRRLNPPMMEVVKKEVLKLLNAGIIYPISDSKWVSPVQVVPKRSGITVVKNADNELVPQRLQTGWRVCIDYRKLNITTRKDHFPLPFIDQMLERLAGHSHYCFLDGYSGYNQIVIAPEDQEKTTFTCPFGTFAYRRMPFGLCNAPATFQRCMMSIFSDMVEKIIEVFMDDFFVFGDSYDLCLNNLAIVLKRCEETNLVLN